MAMESVSTKHGHAVSCETFCHLFNVYVIFFFFFSTLTDGEPDCADKSDEANCTTTSDTTSKKTPINFDSSNCQDWMFKCSNNKCIPYWWKCDSVNDCGDGSDERGCGKDENSTTVAQPTEAPRPQKCGQHEFRCDTGVCISRRYVCDGFADCGRGKIIKMFSLKENSYFFFK